MKRSFRNIAKKPKQDKRAYIIISYFPYVCKHTPHRNVIIDEPTEEAMLALHGLIADSSSIAEVAGCLWTGKDDTSDELTFNPVFLIPDAEKIYEDLTTWCEDKHSKWFTLDWAVREDRYSVVIMPRLDESIKRFKLRCMMELEELPQNDQEYLILFQPLRFGSRPLLQSRSRGVLDRAEFDKLSKDEQQVVIEFSARNMGEMLTKRLPDGSKHRVGLIDPASVDTKNMKITTEPFWIGPLDVRANSKQALDHLADMEEE